MPITANLGLFTKRRLPYVAAMEILESDIDFTPLHERMASYVDREYLPCVSTLIMRGTEVLDYFQYGYMDLESREPLREDAIFRMYSNTKLVTSVALMQLCEQDRFDLDDPLASVLPEFANMRVLRPGASHIDDAEPCAEPILMRHILSHTAGFSYGFIEPESVIDQAYGQTVLNPFGGADPTLEELCAQLAQMPLAFVPGESWRYSLATDVCARVVEVLSGKPFDAYLEEHIFAPLEMVDTGFHVPAEKQGRFVTQYAPIDVLDPTKPGLVKQDDPREGIYTKPRRFLSGGGGLVSTAADYLTFMRMLVSGGIWDGVQILHPNTMRQMRRSQLLHGVKVSFPMWDMPGTEFGLGFALKEQLSKEEPVRALHEYHWGGIAGTHSWMAPAAGIAGLCMTQCLPSFWHPFSHDFKAMAYSLTERATIRPPG